MAIEFLVFFGIEFPSFAPDTETAFCPKAVLRQSICTSAPFLVILCDILFRRSKLIVFTFESAETYRFVYMKDASLSRKMLLKLIHLKSRNGWSDVVSFYIFPVACHFCSKVDTFLYFILQFFTAFTSYLTTIV